MSARLKKGDSVMIIAGGSGKKRENKGKVGKILSIRDDRVIVEGLNIMTRHQKATAPGKPSGKVASERSIHISNVMFYVDSIKKPVRLVARVLDNGKKVRGYLAPKTKDFVQV